MKIIFVKFGKLSQHCGYEIDVNKFFRGESLDEAVTKAELFLEDKNSKILNHRILDIKVLNYYDKK